MTKKIFCGGEFISTNVQLHVHSPWNGEVAGQTYLAGTVELERAIVAALNVMSEMKALSSFEKYDILNHIADLYQSSMDEATNCIILETSKPYKYARAEAERAVSLFRMAAEESRRISGEYIKADWISSGKGKDAIVKYFPAGIVAGISPFNFPLNLVAHKVAPAIAAGCPIIIKPARSTPFSALFMAELVAKTKLPKGAFSVLPMDRQAGNQLVTDDRIAVLSFTGSPEVGWQMKRDAGKKRVVLELGSNAGLIVDKDTDLEKAIPRIVMGAFSFSGQICIHTQRIMVHKNIYDRFLNDFAVATRALKIGNPMEPVTDIASMIDEDNARRVEEWVNEAIASGAHLICGGKRSGAFFEPTILANVRKEMKVCCMEVFGPVVVVEPFEDFNQAVWQVNESRYGLQAGVFTDSICNMNYAFEHIEAGGIVINDVPTYRADHLPYGGMKDSGTGREGVRYAMLDYMDMKVLVKNS